MHTSTAFYLRDLIRKLKRKHNCPLMVADIEIDNSDGYYVSTAADNETYRVILSGCKSDVPPKISMYVRARRKVVTAMKHNGMGLENTSIRDRGDMEIVLAEVTQNGSALQYVLEGLFYVFSFL